MARLAVRQLKRRRCAAPRAEERRTRATAPDLMPVADLRRVPVLPPAVRRNVAANSACPANAHGSPADPIAHLSTIDRLAQDMASWAGDLLYIQTVLNDAHFGGGSTYAAYARWFGTPTRTANGRWRSRFRTATFATEIEAARHEIATLSTRFGQLAQWLGQDIRYRCPGTARYTIPGCSPGPCPAGTAAESCASSGARMIGICPPFWNEPAPRDRAQAALVVHEAVHARFGFRHHRTATPSGRARNPGCYQGFLLEVFGTTLVPGDCTAI